MYGCPTLCEDDSYNQCNDSEILCPAELDENGCTTEQVCIDPFVPGTVPCTFFAFFEVILGYFDPSKVPLKVMAHPWDMD